MTKAEAMRDDAMLELIEARREGFAAEKKLHRSILEALRLGVSRTVIKFLSGASPHVIAQLADDQPTTCSKCGNRVTSGRMSRIGRCPPCTEKWVTT